MNPKLVALISEYRALVVQTHEVERKMQEVSNEIAQVLHAREEELEVEPVVPPAPKKRNLHQQQIETLAVIPARGRKGVTRAEIMEATGLEAEVLASVFRSLRKRKLARANGRGMEARWTKL